MTGYRVLELVDLKGDLCGKLLGDLGADVVTIEPPTGSPVRRLAPFAQDIPGPDRSLLFLTRNTNKRGITLDVQSEAGPELFRRLVTDADVFIETTPPGYLERLGLDYEHLRTLNPRLVMASVTDFGQTGPHRDYKGAPLIAVAMSGAMVKAGYPDQPPLPPSNPLGHSVAATMACLSVMFALYARGDSGDGQYIDISAQESAMACLDPWSVPNHSYGAPGPQRGASVLQSLFPTQDGLVRIVSNLPRHWTALRALLGDPEELAAPEWQEPLYRRDNGERLHELIAVHTRAKTTQDLFMNGQAAGLIVTPLQPPSGYADDPHEAARGFFEEVDHPVVGKARYAGMGAQYRDVPLGIRRPAPLLGEHNDEVYHGQLGISRKELERLRAAEVI